MNGFGRSWANRGEKAMPMSMAAVPPEVSDGHYIGTCFRHVPERNDSLFRNAMNPNDAGFGHSVAIIIAERRNGARHDQVILDRVAGSLVQADAPGAHDADTWLLSMPQLSPHISSSVGPR
jgi:hypothetical protein